MTAVVRLGESLRRARGVLAAALTDLQALEDESLDNVIGLLAEASSRLYEAEALATESTDDAGALRHFRDTTERLAVALSTLERQAPHRPQLDPASEAVAATLALLYPIAQTLVRQRRAVMVGGPAELNKPLANVPRAPEPGHHATREAHFGGSDRRSKEPRTLLEVDIGLLSESHFYTGLSLDMSTGGLFVATYQPLDPGTLVRLFFVLPEGQSVEATGVVRWTRLTGSDTPPGMGVAFEDVTDEARQAIERFCSQRPPLYHESSD